MHVSSCKEVVTAPAFTHKPQGILPFYYQDSREIEGKANESIFQ